jgi:integrase
MGNFVERRCKDVAKNKPLKQPNGAGSVYKLPGRRRKPWVAKITTGWTTTIAQKGKYAGQEVEKQLFQIIGYFEKKEDARKALLEHQLSPVSPKAGITLGELYKEWSEAKFKRVSRSAKDNWSAAWQKLKLLESAKFADIRTSHLQPIIDKAAEAYSRSSLEKIKGVCVMLYKYAMQNDIVDKNYAEFLVLPKETKKEKEIFTDLEIKRLFDAVALEPWADTILIMIYSGMRISEMLELTRFSVDLDKQIITGGIKTDAGKNRVIPIHHKILPFIKKRYDIGADALIVGEKGKPLDARYYRDKLYYPTIDRLNLNRLNPHCCRHTFASLMARAQADPLYIQKIIGHSDYAFTANTYTHTDITELKKAINLIK